MKNASTFATALCLAAAAALVSATELRASAPHTDAQAQLATLKAAYRRPADIPSPAANPTTPEKVQLGKALFFDPRLSGSGAISCASCHNPSLGWQDAMDRGVGYNGSKLGRHTPTILNAAWTEPLFWDGRADTLEDQAKGPLQAPAEMNMPHGDVVRVIKSVSGYREAFAAVFPQDGVTIDTVAKAIAAYERTVVSGQAPFDRWIAGDETAISDSAKRGFLIYNGKANCAACHTGWRMTDDGFHDIGLPSADPGRGKLAPGVSFLDKAFKTPTLRNIAERAPYMHDGSVASLEAVVDHYNDGFVRRASLATEMKPLGLTDPEKADLVAFMKTLSSRDADVVAPTLPR